MSFFPGAQVNKQAGKAWGKGFDWLNKQLEPTQLSSLDPTQQDIYQQLAQALQGGGGPLGDVFGFDAGKMRDLYTQQYA